MFFFSAGLNTPSLDLVKKICSILPSKLGNNTEYEKLIEFVDDRPGHDYRYAIDNSLILKHLDWKPSKSFDEGLSQTIDFYLNKYKQQ